MSDTAAPTDWIVDQPGLTALGLVSALLALVVLLPYLQFVLFGVVLAYILFPVQRRLERYVRPTIAAGAVVVGTLLTVLLPLVYVIAIAVRQSLDVAQSVRGGEFNVAEIEALLEANGIAVDLAALYEANQDRIATAVQEVTMSVMGFLGNLPSLFIGLTVTLFVLFALLRDGERLVAWVQWVLPVDDAVLADLRGGLDDLMWASVVGNVAVAAIQAVLLGVGLAIAGVPAVVFLTVATFVLTLLPLVGAFGVWLPVAGYLVAVGRPTVGAAVVVYGLLVTFSDTYLRPALIGQTEAFNAATVVVGIFGGLIAFGAVGLFIGPVVLGGSKLALDCFARGHAGTPPDGAPPEGSAAEPDATESATGREPTDADDSDADDTDADE
ncbi:AI-2E family transporter [Halopiger aswanensis]|uniref:Putative PurR-regulated permease PerM n=1 Tax=Halopiger aswanensis TaxID=148449 RepID=A0A419WGW4_9EURY|nr:AI-2E family transporter [Halopiger aswanensis]RKD94771.1 putative PurR-regulated permease PerM [Halopiger aswanensis]